MKVLVSVTQFTAVLEKFCQNIVMTSFLGLVGPALSKAQTFLHFSFLFFSMKIMSTSVLCRNWSQFYESVSAVIYVRTQPT
jgi:hypothetical protein